MAGKKELSTTKRIIRIAYFTALTAVGAFIKLPIGPVSFSMQSFFVIMAGLIIGGRDGCYAQLAYMFIGLIGIPIFTQGGGFDYIFKPSFGYIIGFCLGAFVTGTTVRRFIKPGTLKVWLASLAGLLPMYAVGAVYQVVVLVNVNGVALSAALWSLVNIAIFLLFDVVACFLASIVYPRLTALTASRRSVKAHISDSDGESGFGSDKRSGK